MRKITRIGKCDPGRWSARDYAVKCGIVKLARNEKGASHLIEMGHEAADGRDKGVGIIDFHGIDTAGVPVDKIGPRKRQLPINGLPAGNTIGASENAAVVKQGILTRSIEASHASDGVGDIGRGWIGGVATRRRGRAGVSRVEQQNMRRIDVGAVVPDVGDDDASQGTRKIDPHASRRIIGRI
jgi:hypothetical protein